MIFSRVIKPTAVVTNRGHSLWRCADSSDKSSPTTLYFFLWMQHLYWNWGYEYRQFLNYYFMLQLWQKNRDFFLLLWFLSEIHEIRFMLGETEIFFIPIFLPSPWQKSKLKKFLFSLTKKQTKKLGEDAQKKGIHHNWITISGDAEWNYIFLFIVRVPLVHQTDGDFCCIWAGYCFLFVLLSWRL